MTRAVRFLVGLVAVLGLLAGAGYFALVRTTRGWFERDLQLRAELAVASARGSLVRAWEGDPARLGAALDDITRDERIMGAAACGASGEALAATAGYPRVFSCAAVLRRQRADGLDGTRVWSLSAELPTGPVSLSVTPMIEGSRSRGAVVLVHDLRFIASREQTMRDILLIAFFVLALGASAVTLIAARLAWRGWALDLRKALAGGATQEFQPLVRDVRAMLSQVNEERGREARSGAWSPERLRATLREYLDGERVVILANREPYLHIREADGVRVQHPASGLVTALEPVMRACSGTWVAHGSGSADRDTVDAHDRVRVPPGEESYVVRRVWLSDEEEQGYYYGFSNEGLWPLCHVAHARPSFRADDFAQYRAVNERFAEAVCQEVDRDDPIILVQDYHFALAPKMIRERLPKATIISFWHIPWPNAERIGICPWREELIAGLLGSSILGFHTQQHCNNFIDSVDAFMESRIDRETSAVVQGGRKTLVRPYPISIEWPVHHLEGIADIETCRREVREELGLAPDALLGVGVDRLDYTKGIEERLLAVGELLARRPDLRGRFTFAQIAAPSRTKIPRYRDLNERVEGVANEVNERWGSGGYRPIILLRSHHDAGQVFRFYRAAELCYVSSLHDGMNLVAKEYVAARDDHQGVLVLSRFTGAARDLTEALLVNPYDLSESASALAAALDMPPTEQRERMRSMRRLVAEFNVYRWAGRMLIDAAELRRRDRIAGLGPASVPPRAVAP
ncbi:MAG: trehalose-6-phosphate synthase [Polyangiales bacterium]